MSENIRVFWLAFFVTLFLYALCGAILFAMQDDAEHRAFEQGFAQCAEQVESECVCR